MQRIFITGVSGSGKSTLAVVLAEKVGYAHLELDSIYHQANWTPLPIEIFRDRVSEFASKERWVIDGSYSKVRDLVLARADTVIFLDLPRLRVLSQLFARTLSRMFRRRALWNANLESPWSLIAPLPSRNILLWSCLTHAKRRRQFREAQHDPACAHLSFVRLRSRGETEAFLRSRRG